MRHCMANACINNPPLALGLLMSRFLASMLFALAACSLAPASAAYPDRAIKTVAPFAPRGGTDVVARTLAQEMAQALGPSVISENKPGPGTTLATQLVAARPPAGHTLLRGTC